MVNADPPPATDDELLAELDPYRGKKNKLKLERGKAGVVLLHTLVEGSPTSAAEFLGYGQKARANMVRLFSKYGLEVHRRNPEEHKRKEFARWSNNWTLDDWENHLLEVTGADEFSCPVEWRLPKGHDFGILVPIYDVHLPSVACDWQRFIDLCDWLKDHPEARWIGGGDWFEMKTKSSVGSVHDVVMSLHKAIDLFEKRLAPIAKQGIAMLVGNHDNRLLRYEDVDWNPVRELAGRISTDDHKIEFLGAQGHLTYHTYKYRSRKAEVYTHKHHHGIGNAQTTGAAYNALERLMRTTTADLTTMGHLHREGQTELMRQSPGDGYDPISIDRQKGVLCPSFHQYKGYPVDRGMSVTALGVSAVELHADRHTIKVRQ